MIKNKTIIQRVNVHQNRKLYCSLYYLYLHVIKIYPCNIPGEYSSRLLTLTYCSGVSMCYYNNVYISTYFVCNNKSWRIRKSL